MTNKIAAADDQSEAQGRYLQCRCCECLPNTCLIEDLLRDVKEARAAQSASAPQPATIGADAAGAGGSADLPRPAADYAAKNPLGGPASMFEVMAERIRAGEDYAAVLADYGLRSETPAIPAEHTTLMRHRFWQAFHASKSVDSTQFQEAYTAMLAAAPSPDGNEENK